MSVAATRKVPIEAEILGPGPLAYNLPTTVGFKEHDTTKKVNPAWTMRPKTSGQKNINPAPNAYAYADRLTSRGRQEMPQYSLAGRPKAKALEITPGPGAYKPDGMRQGALSSERAPQGKTIGAREGWYRFKNFAPSPTSYKLPSPFGKGSADLAGGRQPTMYSRYDHGSPYYEGKVKGNPGPGAYGSTDPNLFRSKSAAFTVQGRTKVKDYNSTKDNPAPGAYNPNLPKSGRSSGISMGVRHSPYTVMCLTMSDVHHF